MFPVRGAATFTRDFAPPRHNGVDIFAERGAPVLAPEGGELRFGHDPMGGLVFVLRAASGRRYYGAHLERWQGQDRSVMPGDVVGYVGTSGNARFTHPHLHLEVRDTSGAPIDPYPELDTLAGPDVTRGLPAAPGPVAAAQPQPSPAAGSAGTGGQAWLWLALAWMAHEEGWL